MKSAKRWMIWTACMLVAAFCLNFVGTVVVKAFLADKLIPSMTGYASKGESMLHPVLQEPDENERNGLSGLVMRSLLDDERLVVDTGLVGYFFFMNVDIDQSVILFGKDGMSELSKGIFADVYEDTGESAFVDSVRHTVGLISVRDFCELNCAEEIYRTLKEHPNAMIRVDSYSISDFLIQPASVTILDSNDNVIATFDCPCDGEILHAENMYIYDDSAYSDESDLHGFCDKLRDAYLGERGSDRIAAKLVDDVTFENGDQSMQKSGFGFGHYIGKSYEVRGDYAMISVFDMNFTSCVIVYLVIACIPITLLTFLLGRGKKHNA